MLIFIKKIIYKPDFWDFFMSSNLMVVFMSFQNIFLMN